MMDENRSRGAGRCLLLSGGTLEAAFAASVFQGSAWEHVIAADAGLEACRAAGILPDRIIGDFDSLSGKTSPEGARGLLEEYRAAGSRIHRFDPRKDLTDTQIGVELALALGCTDILVLGGTGTRLDHVMGNLQVMELALERGARMILEDRNNRISMHKKPFTIRRKEQWGRYISLIPWGGDVRGVTLRGFSYPMENGFLPLAGSLGISNELTAETGEVFFEEGTLLAFETLD